MSKGRKANPLVGLELMVMFIFLMLFLVIADQFVKSVIDFQMEYQSSIPIIDGFFSLHYVRNTGSAFSFLADKQWGVSALSMISTVLGGLVLILMGIACHKNLKLLGFAFCLIASGAFGNLIDRVRLKYVIDYLRFDFGDYTFPIFNLADICAVLGTFILMGIIIFGAKYFDSFWGSSSKKKDAKKARQPKLQTQEKASGSKAAKGSEETNDETLALESEDYDPVLAIPENSTSGALIRDDEEE